MLIDSAQNSRVALIDLRSLGFPITLKSNRCWHLEGVIESLPLVEGDYSVGLTVHAGDFFENIFELAVVSVSSLPQTNGEVPIPLVYRGVVELGIPTITARHAD